MIVPVLEWTRQLTSFNTPGDETAPCIVTDPAGYSYTCYITTGTVSGGASNHSVNYGDVVVMKMDPSGNIVWLKQTLNMNTSNQESYPYIAIDAAGNLYVTYSTPGTVSGGTLTGSTDLVVFKLNTVGDLQWIKQSSVINAPSKNQSFSSITTDTNGFIYITYCSDGTVSGGTQLGLTDIVVCKMVAATGNIVWIKEKANMNTILSDNHPNCKVDTSGNIYVCYQTDGTTSGNSHTGSSSDIVVFKLNSAGDLQWIHQSNVENNSSSSSNPSIVLDSSRNIYVSYSVSGTVSGGTNTMGNRGNVALLKLDTNGQIIWLRQTADMNTTSTTGGISYTNQPSIGIDASENIYVAYLAINATIPGGVTGGNVFTPVLYKMDSNGNLLWTYQQPDIDAIGTSIDENLNNNVTIAVTPGGDIYFTYFTEGTMSGATFAGGASDIVVIKMRQIENFPGPHFPALGPYITLGVVLVYRNATVDALVAGGAYATLPAQTRVSWAPMGVPARTLLRDLGKSVVVPVSATNRLHAYRFQRVQLIGGSGSEGVGGSLADVEPYRTGWVCTWAASGVAPVF